MKKTILLLALAAASHVHGQLGGLKDASKKLLDKDPVAAILNKKPAITTGLDDVRMDGFLPETFANDSVFAPAFNLQRTPNGGFVLQYGFYEYQAQSYCLKAGTHGPGGGDGYMFAPPLGPMEDIVMAVVRNSVNQAGIQQRDVQLLLWSIIARAKFDDLQNNIKVVAARLLTPRQLAKLNGGAIGLVPDEAMRKGMESLPQPVKTVLEAEAKLRQMLTSTQASFEEVESVAVLAGVAPLGPGSREIPSGRWSLHPDGYYVRYIPSGYSSTHVQIWVPRGSVAVGKEYDPATHIAVPGNTSRQRLIQSGRKSEH